MEDELKSLMDDLNKPMVNELNNRLEKRIYLNEITSVFLNKYIDYTIQHDIKHLSVDDILKDFERILKKRLK